MCKCFFVISYGLGKELRGNPLFFCKKLVVNKKLSTFVEN